MATGSINVPGKLTPADVGAAASNHTHSASDVGAAAAKHSHVAADIPTASTSAYGVTKLSDATNSTATNLAATPNAVKKAYDLANRALTAAGAAQEDATDALDVLKAMLGGTLPSKTLADNSPEVIQRVAALGLGANFWSVGDKIGITLNGTVGSLTFNDTYYAIIIGFNHNPGVERSNSIHFQFGKTSAGVDIAFCDAGYDEYYGHGNSYTDNAKACFAFNTTTHDVDGDGYNAGNKGGWKSSYMRNIICPAFLSVMPTAWRNVIASCTKYSDNTGYIDNTSSSASDVTATLDKIWLLSEFEVLGRRNSANSAEQNYQKQYDYYKNGNSKVRYQHSSTGSTCDWWLRSPSAGYPGGCIVYDNGKSTGRCNAGYSRGFAPGFMVA